MEKQWNLISFFCGNLTVKRNPDSKTFSISLILLAQETDLKTVLCVFLLFKLRSPGVGPFQTQGPLYEQT